MIKPAAIVDCGHPPWKTLRADTVKHGLLTIKHLAWSRVFCNKYTPPGLDSEVLTHLSLVSTLIFIYLPDEVSVQESWLPKSGGLNQGRLPETGCI